MAQGKHEQTPRRPEVVSTGTGHNWGHGPKPNVVIERRADDQNAHILWAQKGGRHRGKG